MYVAAMKVHIVTVVGRLHCTPVLLQSYKSNKMDCPSLQCEQNYSILSSHSVNTTYSTKCSVTVHNLLQTVMPDMHSCVHKPALKASLGGVGEVSPGGVGKVGAPQDRQEQLGIKDSQH